MEDRSGMRLVSSFLLCYLFQGNKCGKGTCTGTNCYNTFVNQTAQMCSSSQPHCQVRMAHFLKSSGTFLVFSSFNLKGANQRIKNMYFITQQILQKKITEKALIYLHLKFYRIDFFSLHLFAHIIIVNL